MDNSLNKKKETFIKGISFFTILKQLVLLMISLYFVNAACTNSNLKLCQELCQTFSSPSEHFGYNAYPHQNNHCGLGKSGV